jgi:hypothetical protein
MTLRRVNQKSRKKQRVSNGFVSHQYCLEYSGVSGKDLEKGLKKKFNSKRKQKVIVAKILQLAKPRYRIFGLNSTV